MTYIRKLSEYLRKNGIETVLCGTGKYKKGETSFSEFVSIAEEKVSNAEYFIALLRKMAFLKVQKGDIIHAQRPDMLFPSVLFSKSSFLVCTLHGAQDRAVFYKKGFVFGSFFRILQTLSFKGASRLIAVDRFTRDYYLKKYPWVKKKMVVIPTGVDIQIFLPLPKKELRKKYHLSEEDQIITFVGRLEKEKNLALLLEAFRQIKAKLKNAKLVFVGRGREEKPLILKVKELNLDDVIFVGEIQNDKIPEWLSVANVFAFCSLFEGSPIVIKEALACNLPVVSVDVGDVKEVIRDIEGCYIAKRNPDDLAKKIMMALTEARKINSREKMIQYSYDNIGKKTMELYTSLLKG